MIRRLVWKETGKVIVEHASDLLIVQQDAGSFQIEEPIGAEIAASAGKVELVQYEATAIGQRLTLKGVFPALPSFGGEKFLVWEAELELRTGRPALDVNLQIHWQGEASRLRFNVSSAIDSSDGIYEIPFGTVLRKPYRLRGTSRGEWPAHRFVAVEDAEYGIAVINTGTAGVEVGGGRISTTLLRAPKAEYAGMVKDETSSQHGKHTFAFAIAPYRGSWVDSAVVKLAQEANTPLLYNLAVGDEELPRNWKSRMTLSPGSVVLSSIKSCNAGTSDLIVRLYETAGVVCGANLWVNGAARAWRTDVQEGHAYEELTCSSGSIELKFEPFEIVTLRIAMEATNGH
jgi:alpha-mannosidase